MAVGIRKRLPPGKTVKPVRKPSTIPVLRKNIIRPHAAISSSQYSWCSPPRTSLILIRGGCQLMPLNCRSPYWLPRSIYLYAELAESRRISGTHRHQFEFLKRCAVSVPLGLTPENLVPAEE